MSRLLLTLFIIAASPCYPQFLDAVFAQMVGGPPAQTPQNGGFHEGPCLAPRTTPIPTTTTTTLPPTTTTTIPTTTGPPSPSQILINIFSRLPFFIQRRLIDSLAKPETTTTTTTPTTSNRAVPYHMNPAMMKRMMLDPRILRMLSASNALPNAQLAGSHPLNPRGLNPRGINRRRRPMYRKNIVKTPPPSAFRTTVKAPATTTRKRTTTTTSTTTTPHPQRAHPNQYNVYDPMDMYNPSPFAGWLFQDGSNPGPPAGTDAGQPPADPHPGQSAGKPIRKLARQSERVARDIPRLHLRKKRQTLWDMHAFGLPTMAPLNPATCTCQNRFEAMMDAEYTFHPTMGCNTPDLACACITGGA